MGSRHLAVLLGSAALAVALAAPAAAQGPTIETVAQGLDTPRGIAIAGNGSLYVVEAGTGGDACMGEGQDQVCMGPTGAITHIVDGTATQVVSGLISFALSGGAEVGGISDLALLDDGSFLVTGNLGGDPARREGMPPEAAQVAGWLVKVTSDGTLQPFSDVAAFEVTDNPEPTMVDSNPYSVAVVDGGFVVADAGGNDLLNVDESGAVSLIAAFPPFEWQFPAEMLAAMGPPPEEENALPVEGEEPAAEEAPAEGTVPAEGEMVTLPVEWVPTSVVVGPDGAYYVGQLTGGPFPVGGASVLRVDPATGESTPYASGFTNIIDIAFGPDGTLYVAEIVHEGLMSVFAGGQPPVGAVWSVPAGGGEPQLLVNDERVMAPGGIAVGADGTVFVSVGTLLPAGAGSVVAITP
jgi:hypothetical protein